MQYILTEQEYKDLCSEKKHKISLDRDKLQQLCIRVANEMPIVREWAYSGVSTPCGCILDSKCGKYKGHNGYCDDCPVSKICPYEHKSYSQ